MHRSHAYAAPQVIDSREVARPSVLVTPELTGRESVRGGGDAADEQQACVTLTFPVMAPMTRSATVPTTRVTTMISTTPD